LLLHYGIQGSRGVSFVNKEQLNTAFGLQKLYIRFQNEYNKLESELRIGKYGPKSNHVGSTG
jgi:hypothetical protein